jgi:hypothetical protein
LILSEEQILLLAPDEASKKSGKDLSNPAKWVSKGANEQALWGEAQGSGSKPYQTQVDQQNIAFKCSCPSRKFPCKHGLGLLLFYAKKRADFSETTAPDWVTAWLSKRAEKEEKIADPVEKPVDEAAKAKRQQARQQKVEDGIEELRLWLKDIVRNGILGMADKGFAWFENMARRMVDAQAGGLATMVRNLGDTNFYAEGWQSRFMDQLLSIYMVIEGYKNSKSLNDLLQQDIRSLIGFTQNQDELKEQSGISDNWLVLCKQNLEVDHITTERNWLYGIETKRYALVLQFIVNGQGRQFTLTSGMVIQAELVFFPSVSPLRAIIKTQTASTQTGDVNAFANWKEVLETETMRCSMIPVSGDRPFIIQQLKPVQYNDEWWLQDASQNMMQMKNQHKAIWKLLALSGGAALNMTVIGKEDQYEPVGVWQSGTYTIL